jgi:hypothetical protein
VTVTDLHVTVQLKRLLGIPPERVRGTGGKDAEPAIVDEEATTFTSQRSQVAARRHLQRFERLVTPGRVS